MAGKFSYGGQAIIEGVMIRGKTAVGIAVRHPNGEIITRVDPPNSLVQNYRWLNIPLLRGTPALFDSLRIGYRALMYSAEVQMEAEAPAPTPTSLPADAPWRKRFVAAHQEFINTALMWLTVLVALVFGVVLFVLIPNQLLYLPKFSHLSPVIKNLIEGVFKIIVFVGYVLLIARMDHVKRLFQYHGAEHMVINAYEHERGPSLEDAQGFSTIHTRCGTAFIALVIFVAIIVHMIAPWPEVWYKAIPLRILLVVPIAGISYEILKFSATPKGAWLAKTLSAPGLWMQKITTQPPTSDQIEVAVKALQVTLDAEGVSYTPSAVAEASEPEAESVAPETAAQAEEA